MGNMFVSVDGFIIHPRIAMEIPERFEGTDRRAINGALLRSIKTQGRIRSWQIVTEWMDETTYSIFYNGLSFASGITFTDQLAIAHNVVLMNKTSSLVRSDPDVDGESEGTGATWYEVSFTLEETGEDI